MKKVPTKKVLSKLFFFAAAKLEPHFKVFFSARSISRYWDRVKWVMGAKYRVFAQQIKVKQQAYLDYFALYANYDAL